MRVYNPKRSSGSTIVLYNLEVTFNYCKVTVDVAWAPGTDGRWYDYKAISDVSDFMFVMLYDEQSQIFDKCIAKANSGVHRAEEGNMARFS